MFSYPGTRAAATFATVLDTFTRAEGLPFADVLTAERIEQAAEQEGVSFAAGDGDVYTPPVVLWAFLAQCLSASKSCVAAVARVLVLRAALGLPPCSAATGGYCRARAKLPESFLRRLALDAGAALERQAPEPWRWKGRRALLADGTECSLPDTPANQAQYPQSTSQKPGLGFPLIRLVVLLGLATGALVGCATGPHQGKETGEPSLFRSLLDRLAPGDVVVADRFYCSYWLVALLAARGVDVAFRLHGRRRYDFRRGTRLGKDDHIVTWERPDRPPWMTEAQYEEIPRTLTIREVRTVIQAPGCRSRCLVVATTLTDPGAFSREDVCDLYHERWHAELDIRAIKQTLGMDVLSCKSPEMVRKEVWAHLLGYNLVRQVMAQAAREADVEPRAVSVAGAVQTLEAARWALLLGDPGGRGGLVRAVLAAVATHRVGNRPGRCEPRKVKRRPKDFPYLTMPRAEERAQILSKCA